jgi:hypothetical protein
MSATDSCLMFTEICVSNETSAGIISGTVTSVFAFVLALAFQWNKERLQKKSALALYKSAKMELFVDIDAIVINEVYGSGSIPNAQSEAACRTLCAFRATVEWATAQRNLFDHDEWREVCMVRDCILARFPLVDDHASRQLFDHSVSPNDLHHLKRRLEEIVARSSKATKI